MRREIHIRDTISQGFLTICAGAGLRVFHSEPPQAEKPVADTGILAPQAITVEMLREIFHGGARRLRRRDAVETLKAAPYFVTKSNTYRALAPSRRYAACLREDEQGWLHFTP